MKINQQQPKIPVQEKNVSKGHERDTDRAAKNFSTQTPALAKVDSNFTVNKVRDKIDSVPDIDAERVAAVKARVKNGEYRIDSLKLSNRILKNSILEDH